MVFAKRFGITERHMIYLEKGKRRPGPTLKKNLESLLKRTQKTKKSGRLAGLSSRLIWWLDPSMVENNYLLKKIMDYGTWADWKMAEAEYGKEEFIRALKTAKVGDFSAEAWNFWHLKLGLRKKKMPDRRILI